MPFPSFTPDQPQGCDVFSVSATAPAAAYVASPCRPPALAASQLTHTQVRAKRQCEVVDGQSLFPSATRPTMPSRGCSASSPPVSPAVSDSCVPLKLPSLVDDEGREVALSPYLPSDEASQRMSFVTDLMTRMHERARLRGRRSSNTSHTSDAGSRRSGVTSTTAKSHDRRSRHPQRTPACTHEHPLGSSKDTRT